MRASIVALALLLPAAAAHAESFSLPEKGMSFARARGDLISKGYLPAPPPPNANGCTVGREDVCNAYPETIDCSGTGLAGCTFMYWKEHRAVIVQTIGEELRELKVSRVKIMNKSNLSKLFGE